MKRTFEYDRVVFYRQGSSLYRQRFLGRKLQATARKEEGGRWFACHEVPLAALVGWDQTERKTGLKVAR